MLPEKAVRWLSTGWRVWLLLATLVVAILFFVHPARSAPAYATFNVYKSGHHIYVKNTGNRAGRVVVSRKLRILRPHHRVWVGKLSAMSFQLRAGQVARVRFPAPPHLSYRRLCKLAGERGVGVTAVVCRRR